MNRNIVVFKGRKDGITILLDDKASFEDVKAALAKKVVDAQKFFGGAKTAIVFQGRELSEPEESELLSIVAEQADLDISFVANDEDIKFTKEETKKAIFEAEMLNGKKINLNEHMTKFQMSSMRSGSEINYPGSVVVLGDVNPGAKIVAEGNIIVLGTLKGVAHAGCLGNIECFVAAMALMPTQLRIADIITYIPENLVKRKKRLPCATYAYIMDGQIYIAPLVDF